MNWTYDKPKKAGLYLINNGDIITNDTVGMTRFFTNQHGELIDPSGIPLARYTNSFKYMHLDPSVLNKIPCLDADDDGKEVLH